MKAWLLDSQTGLGALRLGDAPDPAPAPGQVVLEILFAALNPADRYHAEGQYPAHPPMPHILGRDGLGVVIAAAANTTIPLGSKMLILRGETGVSAPGTFAQKTAVSVESLVPVPPGWTDQQAAGAPLVYLTAWQALTHWPDLPTPSVVLVTGASGGVGVAAVQLAKAMGHTTIALSRSPAKRTQLLTLGADFALDGSTPGWPRQLRDTLAGRRVDLAIDNIGGEQFPQLIETLGDRGRVSIVGRLAGPVPQFNTSSLIFRRLRIGGVAVGAYTAPESRAAWQQIIPLLSAANARLLVDSVFAFDELPKAFERLAAGPMGKVLLAVSGSAQMV